MSTPEPQLTAAAITQYYPAVTDTLQRISTRTKPPAVAVVPYSPLYPGHYTQLANRILAALGPRVLSIAHVGSTSIPQMPSKPIIDIDVVVADPTDEASYVSALVGEGWQATGTGRGSGAEGDGRGAGLQFVLREPEWHQHRFFVCDDQQPAANVHVFGPGCPEVVRHQIFKDWLLAHPEDFEKYAAVKREAAEASKTAGESITQYNSRKEPVLLEILDRAFKAQGLLD